MSSKLSLHELTPPRLPRVQPQGSHPSIELTDQEDKLCTLLNDCTSHLAGTRPDLPTIECRIAGGWVRDKLLGKESNDIDIALSSIMGIEFAELFVPFIEQRGVQVRNVTKIARNPEQSKHLETCKATLMGLEIDFVNLRSEEYALDSRIPTKIDFGTPLQDALRRDITTNALFYNIHTRSVEDFTEKGWEDLRNGIARTPLAPKETFLDDPLRVLRVVRFASRFGWSIDPSVFEAAVDPEVKQAIVSKISRDRVGEEMDKMMKGRDPLHSLQLIDELSVHEEIFFLPTSYQPSAKVKPRRISRIAATLLSALLSPGLSSLPPLNNTLAAHALADSGTRRRLYLAAALTPFRDSICVEKKKPVPTPEIVIREGLKLGNQNRYLSGVPLLLQAQAVLSKPALSRFSEPAPRVSIGIALRDKRVSNPLTEAHWSASAVFSLVQDLLDIYDFEKDELDATLARGLIEMYNDFAARVQQLALEPAIHAPPLLDGKKVCGLLGAKPGTWVAGALELVVAWQLGHPDGTKEECAAFLEKEFQCGRLTVGESKPGADDRGGKKKKMKTKESEVHVM